MEQCVPLCENANKKNTKSHTHAAAAAAAAADILHARTAGRSVRRPQMELPSSFDVVVVGTGLTESLVAAAAARAGKTVLHLDTNPFYGARNATFNLSDLTAWLAGSQAEDNPVPQHEAEVIAAAAAVGDGATLESEPLATLAIERVPERPSSVSYVAAAQPPADVVAGARRYSLDLTPQLLLSAGSMVDTLRTSGVANYIEFKPVGGYLYGEAAEEGVVGGGGGAAAGGGGGDAADGVPPLRKVPTSKGDIFQAASIPLIQKRQLMKFLQSCLALQPTLEPEVGVHPHARASPDAAPAPIASAEGSFLDFVARQHLSPALADLALYGILQLPTNPNPAAVPTAAEGVRTVCRHLRSLGVFGPTAYLAAVYGASEMPQGFCRLCAVWGGVYMLNGRALELELEEEGERGATRVRAIRGPEGRRVRCAHLVLNGDSKLPRLPPCRPPPPRRRRGRRGRRRRRRRRNSTAISRCICILDGALLAGVDGGDEAPPKPISLATLFPGRGGVADAPRTGSTVFALEQSSEAGVCPRGQWVLHLSAESRPGVSPASLLRPPLERLLAQQATAATARRAAAAAAAAAAKEAGRRGHRADGAAGRRPPVVVHRVVARDAHRVPESLKLSDDERGAVEGARGSASPPPQRPPPPRPRRRRRRPRARARPPSRLHVCCGAPFSSCPSGAASRVAAPRASARAARRISTHATTSRWPSTATRTWLVRSGSLSASAPAHASCRPPRSRRRRPRRVLMRRGRAREARPSRRLGRIDDLVMRNGGYRGSMDAAQAIIR